MFIEVVDLFFENNVCVLLYSARYKVQVLPTSLLSARYLLCFGLDESASMTDLQWMRPTSTHRQSILSIDLLLSLVFDGREVSCTEVSLPSTPTQRANSTQVTNTNAPGTVPLQSLSHQCQIPALHQPVGIICQIQDRDPTGLDIFSLQDAIHRSLDVDLRSAEGVGQEGFSEDTAILDAYTPLLLYE